jgi:aryl-alcohol dehydrogenase-like predicted oxidoreductase
MPAQRPTKEDQLEKRTIGSLEVSVVGLGCNNFGWRIDAVATARVVDSVLDAGINFLDTADIYGNGQSEEFLGQALKGRWDRVVIATKFGSKMDDQRQGAGFAGADWRCAKATLPVHTRAANAAAIPNAFRFIVRCPPVIADWKDVIISPCCIRLSAQSPD